jgi:hypothetical protein
VNIPPVQTGTTPAPNAYVEIRKAGYIFRGWRVRLVHRNGHELMSAQTVYNDKRDAFHLARTYLSGFPVREL